MDVWKIRREIVIVLVIVVVTAVLFIPGLLQPVTTCVVGDVRARWNGLVPAELREVFFDAQKMELGLGTAALDGWSGLGDALAVGGRVWLRPTDRGAADFYRLATSRYFQSNAFTYVPKGQTRHVSWRPVRDTTLADNWTRLARDFPDGVVAAGFVRFQELRMIAIAAPAADGRPILHAAAQYYTQPMETAYDAWAYVIGLTAPEPGNRFWDQAARIRLFVPVAIGKSTHAHALHLRGKPKNRRAPPQPEQVLNVGEVVDSSIIGDGEFALFPVTRAAGCRDAIRAAPIN